MIGKIIGKVVTAPVRVLAIPAKVVEHVAPETARELGVKAVGDGLVDFAERVEEGVEEAVDS